ncbi:11539_t:CDS:2 [Paraglomus brasilianum]|uniref:11539_t:CDS:1 n=1 Tax=Paraglomus brasilianum TaxID=144538 RepID=A0A9N9CVS2_9GLOM|nr:11539_t:CDS:2 [Paraglomus brasilianum]
MSQDNNTVLQTFDDTSHYTRNHFQSTAFNQLSNLSATIEQLENENRDLKVRVSELEEENRKLKSEVAPHDKQQLRDRLQNIKSMCDECESILGIKHLSLKQQIGYHSQGQVQNHVHLRPQNGENMMAAFNFGSQSMLTTKPPTPERMVEETNGPPSPSNSHENSIGGGNNDFPSFTVWVAWRGRPSTDAPLRQIFGGLDIKDVRPSPNKSFAHIDFSTADSMHKALARDGEDIPNFGHLRVEKGNPHPSRPMGKNHSLPSSSSSPLSSSSLQSPNSPQSHSSPNQPSFSSPPLPPHTPTSFSDNRPRQQNQQNRKNDYVRGGYPNAFNRQNSSSNNYEEDLENQNKAMSIKGWQDMAAQGTTSIPNHQEHKADM